MKTLSLIQPWATLIAIGEKTIETRSWSTNYRGPVAIHASARWGRAEKEIIQEWPFTRFDLKNPPLGAVIAIATLVDVRPTEEWMKLFMERSNDAKPEFEDCFGNYDAGRFGWKMVDVRPLRTPIPAKGSLGLWEWNIPTTVDLLESVDP